MSVAHLNKRMAGMKFFLGFLTGWIFLVLLSLVVPVHATQITLGNSAPGVGGQFEFTNLGGGNIRVDVESTVIGPNAAFYGGDIGGYTFEATSFVAGPQSGGIYPATGTEALEIFFGDGDFVTGTVTWIQVGDGSLTPRLDGTYAIATVCCDAMILADYPAGSSPFIDLTIGPVDTDLEHLTEFEFGNASSGEIVPGDSPPVSTPEPGSPAAFIFVMVAAMIGFHGYTRRTETAAMISRAQALLGK